MRGIISMNGFQFHQFAIFRESRLALEPSLGETFQQHFDFLAVRKSEKLTMPCLSTK